LALQFDEIIKARLTMDVKPKGGQTNSGYLNMLSLGPLFILGKIDPGFHDNNQRAAPCFSRSPSTCHKKVVFPVRRMPITAVVLPGTPGSRTSRRVKAGTGEAKESTIFCLISSLIYPSPKDNIAYYYPLGRDKYL
jgi:hypothetical protein